MTSEILSDGQPVGRPNDQAARGQVHAFSGEPHVPITPTHGRSEVWNRSR
jgi:hypothetical protein